MENDKLANIDKFVVEINEIVDEVLKKDNSQQRKSINAIRKSEKKGVVDIKVILAIWHKKDI